MKLTGVVGFSFMHFGTEGEYNVLVTRMREHSGIPLTTWDVRKGLLFTPRVTPAGGEN